MIAVSIAHALHIHERHATLARMLRQLGEHTPHVETHRGPPHEWSVKQWEGAIALGQDHCLMLNDDLILCDDFIPTLERVIEARPEHIISLYNSHAKAIEADKLGLRWLTSIEGLIGNAYVIPTEALKQFLEWRANDLLPGVAEELSEDQLINLFAMSRGALIWHTVPALVGHDETIASCYGNKPHSVAVGPRSPMPTDWNTDGLPLGRYFIGNHHYLIKKLKVPLVQRYFEAAGG